MKLAPTLPPGRNARKAREFTAEIGQLRAAGYTFEAIRHALAAVGVQVSNTTVQREVARALGRRHPARVGARPVALPPLSRSESLDVSTSSALPCEDASRGLARWAREHAEEFLRGQITNPLLRGRQPR